MKYLLHHTFSFYYLSSVGLQLQHYQIFFFYKPAAARRHIIFYIYIYIYGVPLNKDFNYSIEFLWLKRQLAFTRPWEDYMYMVFEKL